MCVYIYIYIYIYIYMSHETSSAKCLMKQVVQIYIYIFALLVSWDILRCTIYLNYHIFLHQTDVKPSLKLVKTKAATTKKEK